MIPFWLTPHSWGLKGIERDKARINHEYTGEIRERKLIDLEYDQTKKALEHLRLDLRYNKISQYEFDLKENEIVNKSSEFFHFNELKIKLRHNQISQYNYDKEEAKLIFSYDETKLKLILLDIDFKYEKISKLAYEKETATIKDEPWVGVKDSSYDKEEGLSGFYFDLDCNDAFIRLLTKNDYRGHSQDEILQKYFNDLCRTIAIEEGYVNPEEYSIDNINVGKNSKK